MAAEGTAERLSAYVHVLRSLVHLNLGWLASEPRLEAKRALGRHAREDARSVDEMVARLGDLPAADGLPGGPAGTLADVIERVGAAPDHQEYVQLAYGALKPTLVQLLREHRDAVDPLLDEPTLEVVTVALARQARHLVELPARAPHSLSFETRVEPYGALQLPVVPSPQRPARDPFVEAGDGSGDLHRALNDELLAAEILSRAAHEHGHLPWSFHSDVARLVDDRLRHTGALDAAGAHWGRERADTGPFDATRGLGLHERLAAAHDLARSAADAYAPLRDDLTPFARAIERWSDER
jgi:hypothetical protein